MAILKLRGSLFSHDHYTLLEKKSKEFLVLDPQNEEREATCVSNALPYTT